MSTDLKETVRRYRQREVGILADNLMPFLIAQGEKIRIIDGGAGRAELATTWRALPPEMVSLHGFDPDTADCERLNKLAREAGLDHHFHPMGLWSSKGKQTIYIAEVDASLYQPNEALLKRWWYGNNRSLWEMMKVQRTAEVECTTIDEWVETCQVSQIDFIKLNVQASELEILKGGVQTLQSVLGLQLEASFAETYRDQPLFSALSEFVQAHGFFFFDFLAPNIVGRAMSPVRLNVPQSVGIFRWPSRQIFEGHFLWLRDPIATGESIDVSQVVKLACIAETYGQVEYAFELLVWLTQQLQASPELGLAENFQMVIDGCAALYRECFPEVIQHV